MTPTGKTEADTDAELISAASRRVVGFSVLRSLAVLARSERERDAREAVLARRLAWIAAIALLAVVGVLLAWFTRGG